MDARRALSLLGLLIGCSDPHIIALDAAVNAQEMETMDAGNKDEDPRSDVGPPAAAVDDSGPMVLADAGSKDSSNDADDSSHPGRPVPMVSVPAGNLLMGSATSTQCRRSNEDRHEIVISRAFELMPAEVTQAEYFARRGYTPSSSTFCGSDCPVENLSWHEAVAYCNALSEEQGITPCYDCVGKDGDVLCGPRDAYLGAALYDCPGYRLPTEAEWELAYRASGKSAAPFYAAESVAGCGDVADADAGQVAWYARNSGSPSVALHPVKQKVPNYFGLYDMAGNVAEWVADTYVNNLGLSPVKDPLPPADGTFAAYRTIKGGFYGSHAEMLRAAHRAYDLATRKSPAVGFRCARGLATN